MPVRLLRAVMATLALLGVVLGLALVWAQRPFADLADTRHVEVRRGAGLNEIARAVAAQTGMPAWPFVVLVKGSGNAARLHAGLYAIEPGMSPWDVYTKLVNGDVEWATLTVPEGWTFAQMRAAIAASSDLKQEWQSLSDTALMTALGAPGVSPEGRFFPDTYKFARGSPDRVIYRQAYEAMQRALAQAWAARVANSPLASPDDLLILASIVEKETARPEDRGRVAAVFVNRLRTGMLLQTDPTVIYGLGNRFDGNLRKQDLLNDTPYNTYTRAGLPPTPIALPGRDALMAAAAPDTTRALYFVARGDGSSEFSDTLDAHNRAVNRYQRKP